MDTTPAGGDADIAALKARVAELEAQIDTAAAADRPLTARTGWWRPVVVVVLLVLAGLLAPLSVVATWADDQVGDTDRYVETVAPLASDPAVQGAITDRVTSEIVTAIDAESLVSEALTSLSGQEFVPSRAATLLPSLAVPLANGLETFVHDRVAQFVASDTFETAWIEANRQAHGQMVAVLTGDVGEGAVSVRGGEVSINVAAIVDAVKTNLIAEGFEFAERIPTVNATFTVFQAENIGTAQKIFSWLDTVSTVLPFLTLLVIFAAVMIARDRRRTLVAAGLVVTGAMVLLGLTLNLVRPAYLDAVPDDILPADAAAVIYDQLVLFIRTALRAVGILFLAIAVVAFLFAPSGAGAACRRALGSLMDQVRGRAVGAGMNTGPVGAFLGTYRTFVRCTVAGLAALAYLSVDHPSGRDVLVILAATVIALIVIEFLAAPEAETQEVPAQV